MSFNVTPGSIRFNTDSMKLEYYHLGSVGFGTLAAGEWVQITTDTPDVQTGGARGLGMGGSPTTDTVDYWTISTTGNAIDFGNLSTARFTGAALDQNSCIICRRRNCTRSMLIPLIFSQSHQQEIHRFWKSEQRKYCTRNC